MCMSQVDIDGGCDDYVPDINMLNATRPPPYKLGALSVCDASEAEIWRTSGYFKVGDEEHQPDETRSGCPCVEAEPDGPSCRRQAKQDGKLDFADDKICGILIKKVSLLWCQVET